MKISKVLKAKTGVSIKGCEGSVQIVWAPEHCQWLQDSWHCKVLKSSTINVWESRCNLSVSTLSFTVWVPLHLRHRCSLRHGVWFFLLWVWSVLSYLFWLILVGSLLCYISEWLHELACWVHLLEKYFPNPLCLGTIYFGCWGVLLVWSWRLGFCFNFVFSLLS